MYKVLLGYLAVACLLWYISSFRIHTKKRQSRRIFNDELNVTNHEQQDDLEPGFTYHQQQKVFNFADNFSKANETPAHEEKSSANLSLLVQSGSSHVVQPTTAPSCQGGCTKAPRPPGFGALAGRNFSHCPPPPPEYQPFSLPGPKELPQQLDSAPKIGEQLGSGGFGCVYEGEGTFRTDPSTTKFVAVKLQKVLKEARPMQGLEYEAQVLYALHQVESKVESKVEPKVVESKKKKKKEGKAAAAAAKIPELIDFRTVGDIQVMTTQLLHRDLSHGEGVAEEDIKHYAKQIFLGLKDMHDKDFVHCDIKPENLMVGFPRTPEEKQVYIVDFGLAHHMSQTEAIFKRKNIKGTWAYMSKSLLGGEEPRGFKHDVIAAVYTLLRIVRRSDGRTVRLPWELVPEDVREDMTSAERRKIVIEKMQGTTRAQLYVGLDDDTQMKFANALDACDRIAGEQYYYRPEYEMFVGCFE